MLHDAARARIRSCGGPLGSLFLHAIPYHGGVKLPGKTLAHPIRLRLGLEIHAQGQFLSINPHVRCPCTQTPELRPGDLHAFAGLGQGGRTAIYQCSTLTFVASSVLSCKAKVPGISLL
jgi:hypothetical protein